MNQCADEQEPVLTKISDIIDIDNDNNVVLIKIKVNNYDYGGLSALYI